MKYQEIASALVRRDAFTKAKLVKELQSMFPCFSVRPDDKAYTAIVSYRGEGMFKAEVCGWNHGRIELTSCARRVYYTYDKDGRNGVRHEIDDSDADLKRCQRFFFRNSLYNRYMTFVAYSVDNYLNVSVYGTRTHCELKELLNHRRYCFKRLMDAEIPWEVRSYLGDLKSLSYKDKASLLAELPLIKGKVEAMIAKDAELLIAKYDDAKKAVEEFMAKRKAYSIF